jgi:hypothetical protein
VACVAPFRLSASHAFLRANPKKKMGPTQKGSPLIPSGAAGTPGDKKWFVWKKKRGKLLLENLREQSFPKDNVEKRL